MNAGGGDLVGAWYELGRSLVSGRPVDPASGWPVLTTREAFELARSWALVLTRMGDAVAPIAARWIDDARALLAESVGPDELLPSSVALWEVGAALLAPRNAGKPWDGISVSLDAAGGLHVANVDDPNWLEIALRKFFASRGRAEREDPAGKYVEVSIGEATQIIALWGQYVAKVKTKRLEKFTSDPIERWIAWVPRAQGLIAGKPTDALFPVEEASELWRQQRRLAGGISVILDNQPLRGWSGFVAAAKAVTGEWLIDAGAALGGVGDGAKDAAVAVGGGVKDAAAAVGGGAKDAALAVGGGVKDAAGAVAGGAKDVARAVERGVSGILKPLAIGAGILGAGVLAVVLVKK